MEQHAHKTRIPAAAMWRTIKKLASSASIGIAIIAASIVLFLWLFDQRFQGKVYPNVTIDGISFGSKTPADIEAYWLTRNVPFREKTFVFTFENHIATISAADLDIGYDATLSARQAYLIGRSGHVGTDMIAKFGGSTNISPYFRWNTSVLDDTLVMLSDQINIPVIEALFQFNAGKVTAFRPSQNGRRVNSEETRKRFAAALAFVPTSTDQVFSIPLIVDAIRPSIETKQTNIFGIKERISQGYSEFSGSIPGRIHNVLLTASKLNGVLIKPGAIFSFNDTVGDISAATGFQQAYIIKEGRTVLGDGGGVCQVSSTLFRAALNAGLPIVERHAHAYRVHYYEEGGFKPGLDATVYSPTYDLKFKNDTPGYILIQTKADPRNLTLTFDLYGTGDGRVAQILNHQVGSITPPPPDLYQDDPTLPPGVVKQVDWAAWGAKASFQYKVTRNNEVLQNETFYSNFRPWQAVYLRGTAQ